MSGRLISVGNVVLDVTLTIAAIPASGDDVLASDGGLHVGGTFNLLAGARRYGMDAIYGGVLGAGPLGHIAAEALRREGIVVAGEPNPDVDTGFTVAVTDATGERTFLSCPGAEATLGPDRLRAVPVAAGDWVYVSGYGLAHTANRTSLLGWIPTLDPSVTVVFDPGPLVALLPAAAVSAVLDRTDWCSANRREGLTLCGMSDPIAAATALADRVRAGAVVRSGREGCAVARHGTPAVHVPGFDVATVDTNGAGDAHTANLLAMLADGAALEAAARWANAAAALAVGASGPATGPTAAEVAAWLALR